MLCGGFGPDAAQWCPWSAVHQQTSDNGHAKDAPDPRKVVAMPDSTFWLALAVLGVAVALSVVQGRSKDQLGRVERKLDVLLKHAQVDVPAAAGREAAA